jgi:hypothetical protein
MSIFVWLLIAVYLLTIFGWLIWKIWHEPGLTNTERLIWLLVCIALGWWGYHMFQREHGHPTGIWRYFRD